MIINVTVEVIKRPTVTDGIHHNIYAVLKNGIQTRAFNDLSDDNALDNLQEYLDGLERYHSKIKGTLTIKHLTEAQFLADGGQTE